MNIHQHIKKRAHEIAEDVATYWANKIGSGFKPHKNGYTIIGFFKDSKMVWTQRMLATDDSKLMRVLAKKIRSGRTAHPTMRQPSNWVVAAIFQGYHDISLLSPSHAQAVSALANHEQSQIFEDN